MEKETKRLPCLAKLHFPETRNRPRIPPGGAAWMAGVSGRGQNYEEDERFAGKVFYAKVEKRERWIFCGRDDALQETSGLSTGKAALRKKRKDAVWNKIFYAKGEGDEKEGGYSVGRMTRCKKRGVCPCSLFCAKEQSAIWE